MATVFRAEHVLLQRAAAIKFLHADLNSEAARARFLREARVVAKLTHPNVVSIFDFGVTDDGTYYLASELVDGPTLRELVRGRQIEPWRALRFARQIAAGLGSAHEAGVIHRDLKPGNVMAVADKTAVEGYRLKVLDFGIAKSVNAPPASDVEVTEIGIVVGTPGYMSPEQCRADTEIGPATDIYSLGVVLYSMLCGQPPFIANDVFVLAEMHINLPPPAPSAICGCSALVDDLVLRLLAKSPNDRPSSMDEVIALIDAALADLPATTSDVAAIEPEPPRQTEKLEMSPFAAGTLSSESSRMSTFAAPPRRRTRTRMGLVVVAIIGAGVLAAIAWPSSPSEPDQVVEPTSRTVETTTATTGESGGSATTAATAASGSATTTANTVDGRSAAPTTTAPDPAGGSTTANTTTTTVTDPSIRNQTPATATATNPATGSSTTTAKTNGAEGSAGSRSTGSSTTTAKTVAGASKTAADGSAASVTTGSTTAPTRAVTVTRTNATATKRPVRRPTHAKRKPSGSGTGSGSEAPDYSFETPVE
jgi:serine/threonine-protein kinase